MCELILQGSDIKTSDDYFLCDYFSMSPKIVNSSNKVQTDSFICILNVQYATWNTIHKCHQDMGQFKQRRLRSRFLSHTGYSCSYFLARMLVLAMSLTLSFTVIPQGDARTEGKLKGCVLRLHLHKKKTFIHPSQVATMTLTRPEVHSHLE